MGHWIHGETRNEIPPTLGGEPAWESPHEHASETARNGRKESRLMSGMENKMSLVTGSEIVRFVERYSRISER